jgi:hypothetical protein
MKDSTCIDSTCIFFRVVSSPRMVLTVRGGQQFGEFTTKDTSLSFSRCVFGIATTTVLR